MKQNEKSRKKWNRMSSGQAAVQFAALLVPALTLLFGIMQGAEVANAYNWVTYAARDGARYAMVRGSGASSPATSSSVSSYVKGEAQGLNTQNLTVTTTWPTNNSPGSVVKVQVTYNFAPFSRLWSTAQIPMTSTSQMVISH